MTDLAKFDALEKEFFNTLTKRDPILSSSLGLHQYDDKMPDGSVEKELEDIRILNKYLRGFSKINIKKLSPHRVIDLELAIHTIKIWLFEKEEIRYWESSPEAPELIGISIFQVLSRNYAPLTQRLKSIHKRLEQIPHYIKKSREKLRSPIKQFVEDELETITRLPGFFNNLKDIARENLLKTPYYNFHRSIERVHDALEDYSNWLIIDVLPTCREDFVIGEKKFEKLLKLRGIDKTPRELIKFGDDELTHLQEKLKQLGRQIKRRSSVEDARELIRSKHPKTFEDVLKYMRDSVQKARQFVIRSDFAKLPSNENLYVIETPSFMRHTTPFAAYWPPAKFEEKQDGYYFVTPGDSENERLKEHNYASMHNTTIHEAYPGHHLQLTCANTNKSLIRAFADATETVEGWAHYCEEQAKELGFDDTPEARFAQTLDMVWRAARIIIDVKLHTGAMTAREAMEFLADTTGMEWSAAEAEIRRYTKSPTYQLSYLIGKELIKDLKRYVRSKMKEKFTDLFFHNTFLYAGSLPIDLMRKEFDWKIEEELTKKERKRKTKIERTKTRETPSRKIVRKKPPAKSRRKVVKRRSPRKPKKKK